MRVCNKKHRPSAAALKFKRCFARQFCIVKITDDKLVPDAKKKKKQRVQTTTEGGVYRSSPYPAAFEHSRVDQVRAHQSHVDAILLRGLQLMAQWLVEADGTKLTGAVILRE